MDTVSLLISVTCKKEGTAVQACTQRFNSVGLRMRNDTRGIIRSVSFPNLCDRLSCATRFVSEPVRSIQLRMRIRVYSAIG